MCMTDHRTCLTVMIKLVQKGDARRVKNYFMCLRLGNIVLSVPGNCQNHNEIQFIVFADVKRSNQQLAVD